MHEYIYILKRKTVELIMIFYEYRNYGVWSMGLLITLCWPILDE